MFSIHLYMYISDVFMIYYIQLAIVPLIPLAYRGNIIENSDYLLARNSCTQLCIIVRIRNGVSCFFFCMQENFFLRISFWLSGGGFDAAPVPTLHKNMPKPVLK
jgi:hypothetical protein